MKLKCCRWKKILKGTFKKILIRNLKKNLRRKFRQEDPTEIRNDNAGKILKQYGNIREDEKEGREIRKTSVQLRSQDATHAF